MASLLSSVAATLSSTVMDWLLLDSLAVVSGGKSLGMSGAEVDLSECKPTGFKGSLSVPLFGRGSMPRESQTIL